MKFIATHKVTGLTIEFSVDVAGLNTNEIVSAVEYEIEEILSNTDAPREAFDIKKLDNPY